MIEKNLVCPKCGAEAKTVLAETKDKKTWFRITFCPRCLEVLDCMFRGTKDKKLLQAFLNSLSKGEGGEKMTDYSFYDFMRDLPFYIFTFFYFLSVFVVVAKVSIAKAVVYSLIGIILLYLFAELHEKWWEYWEEKREKAKEGKNEAVGKPAPEGEAHEASS